MITGSEQAYREHLSDTSPVLVAALEGVVPTALNQDPATELTRALCFDRALYGDSQRPPFSDNRRSMLDHGVRQVALASAVLLDGEIRDRLPPWFDTRLFAQALLVSDVGLSFVPDEEVRLVERLGPKFIRDYVRHPEFGFGMAESQSDLRDSGSLAIASVIARHHMVQATHQYGLEWWEMGRRGVDTTRVDMMVALQKPFDHFDDSFTRQHLPPKSYEEQVSNPLARFSDTFGQLLCGNLMIVAGADRDGFDVALPGRISRKIQEVVLDDGSRGVGELYRQLDAELTSARAEGGNF